MLNIKINYSDIIIDSKLFRLIIYLNILFFIIIETNQQCLTLITVIIWKHIQI